MADQLGKSVGDMYKGAFIPGLTRRAVCRLRRPRILRAAQMGAGFTPEARVFREPNGKTGGTCDCWY